MLALSGEDVQPLVASAHEHALTLTYVDSTVNRSIAASEETPYDVPPLVCEALSGEPVPPTPTSGESPEATQFRDSLARMQWEPVSAEDLRVLAEGRPASSGRSLAVTWSQLSPSTSERATTAAHEHGPFPIVLPAIRDEGQSPIAPALLADATLSSLRNTTPSPVVDNPLLQTVGGANRAGVPTDVHHTGPAHVVQVDDATAIGGASAPPALSLAAAPAVVGHEVPDNVVGGNQPAPPPTQILVPNNAIEHGPPVVTDANPAPPMVPPPMAAVVTDANLAPHLVPPPMAPVVGEGAANAPMPAPVEVPVPNPPVPAPQLVVAVVAQPAVPAAALPPPAAAMAVAAHLGPIPALPLRNVFDTADLPAHVVQ